jgi:hypothetical protein
MSTPDSFLPWFIVGVQIVTADTSMVPPQFPTSIAPLMGDLQDPMVGYVNATYFRPYFGAIFP